jgi:hypothetical protein
MRALAPALFAAALLVAAPFAQASEATASCSVQAGDKKLAGAAKNSFMKKCETDAASRCEAAAAEKKLAGAAKTSFTKKCVADAVGPAS